MIIEKEIFINILRDSCISSRNHSFAFWKLKTLALEGETYCIPETHDYYLVYRNMLAAYITRSGGCLISAEELNRFNCISITDELFAPIKDKLNGFNVNYGYKLHYDYSYPLPRRNQSYSIVEFDFSDRHFSMASTIINQSRNGWMMPDNVRKITREPVFTPQLWFFAQENSTSQIAGVAISTFDKEIEETDIEWIYVLPLFQNKGVGRFLLTEIINRSIKHSKDIRVGGTNEFYRKCGFIEKECSVWATKNDFSFVAPSIQPNILP